MSDVVIANFYEFRRLQPSGLPELARLLQDAMGTESISGTVLLAEEGFNAAICGGEADVERFVAFFETLFDTRIAPRLSRHSPAPFRRREVKIRPEIVALRKEVDITLGEGTHVTADEWDALVTDPSVVVLDARNHYEHVAGTFPNAVDPMTDKFSELPDFVEKNLDPAEHPRVAMFCTGGIRCEKFAPYLRARGFREVYQLKGGILGYLEQKQGDGLWRGECFVFDERVTVGDDLRKGDLPDPSLPA